jgi:hypothetical protein
MNPFVLSQNRLTQLAAAATVHAAVLRLGSLAILLECGRREDRDAVCALFRTDPARPSPRVESGLVVRLSDAPRRAEPSPLLDAPPDRIAFYSDVGAGEYVVATDALTLRLFRGASPEMAYVFVRDGARGSDRLAVHLSVALHRMLFAMGRVYLHAAAVKLGDRTTVFAGAASAGKSTLSLRLGTAGATVLADDHVVVRRDTVGFLVSGCDHTARVTKKTEGFLFAEPLATPEIEVNGVVKREVSIRDLAASEPFVDAVPGRLAFVRLGERLSISAVSRGAAVTELLAMTRRSHRFAGPADYVAHLEFFSGFVEALETFAIELSPDLRELDRVVEWARHG